MDIYSKRSRRFKLMVFFAIVMLVSSCFLYLFRVQIGTFSFSFVPKELRPYNLLIKLISYRVAVSDWLNNMQIIFPLSVFLPAVLLLICSVFKFKTGCLISSLLGVAFIGHTVYTYITTFWLVGIGSVFGSSANISCWFFVAAALMIASFFISLTMPAKKSK